MTDQHVEVPDYAPSPVPPKVDPGVIVSLAAVAAAGVAGTAWYALEPRSAHLALQSGDRDPVARPSSDTLGALPASYAGVPKLGPPLPGDLGRPILERQRQLASSTGSGPEPVQGQAAGEAREHQLSDLKAARESGLMVQARHSNTSPQSVPIDLSGPSGLANDAAGKLSIDADRDPNGQQRKVDFVRTADKGNDTNPFTLVPSPSPFTLAAGSVISASLITGLRSDLPGLVTAQVTEQTFDSATGRFLLVPQGARLVGSYDSVVAFGQRRALVVRQRIIFPDGSSMRLDNAPATDPSGFAGLSDEVDFHTWSLLKGVVLSTLLGVGAELQFSGESDLVQALRQSTQQSVSQAGSQLTSRNLQVQPTITIRPGAPVRLLVHHDLILKPWKETD
jgi:type IV secretory pathway VirB10-like protein